MAAGIRQLDPATLLATGKPVAAAKAFLDLDDQVAAGSGKLANDLIRAVCGRQPEIRRRFVPAIMRKCPRAIRASALMQLIDIGLSDVATKLALRAVRKDASLSVLISLAEVLVVTGHQPDIPSAFRRMVQLRPDRTDLRLKAAALAAGDGDAEQMAEYLDGIYPNSDPGTASRIARIRSKLSERGSGTFGAGSRIFEGAGHYDVGHGMTMRRTNNDRCFVLFPGLFNSAVGKAHTALDDLLKARGIGLVTVTQGRRRLHLAGFADEDSSFDESIESLQSELADRGLERLATVGISGSGVAALSTGARLNASGVLLFSGVTHIPRPGPELPPRASRSAGLIWQRLAPGEYDSLPDLRRNPVLIQAHYPQESPFDVAQVERLGEIGTVRARPADIETHNVLGHLANTGRLEAALDEFIAALGWD